MVSPYCFPLFWSSLESTLTYDNPRISLAELIFPLKCLSFEGLKILLHLHALHLVHGRSNQPICSPAPGPRSSAAICAARGKDPNLDPLTPAVKFDRLDPRALTNPSLKQW